MRKGIFPVVILLTFSFLLLSVAESQERLVTDEIGRKVKIPLAPGRIVSHGSQRHGDPLLPGAR